MKIKVYLALALVSILWGVNNVALKIAADLLPPFTSGTLRYGIAALFFIPLALYLYRKGEMRWPNRTQWFWLFILGLLGIFGFSFFLFFSMRYTTASEASILVGFNPLLTYFLAWLLLKEEWVWVKFSGIVLAVVGVVITLYQPGQLSISHPVGNGILMLSISCWVGYTLLSKKVMQAQNLNPTETAIYATFLGTALMIPTAFLLEDPLSNLGKIDLFLWLDFLYMGVLATGVAYVLWNYGIKEIGAGSTSAFLSLLPPAGVIASILILKEPSTPNLFLGMVLVMVGVWLTTREIKLTR